ncbi:hypothetical protein F2Q70_00016050 [Brassica cretica]|uniref:Large ribosomal subunit protein uL6 N-terminal domain-containing protein n=1 Tax=Brassica cretica TaxID=69181 RepID=A0A8S9HSZ0_BRACR|nr:hypothetical protein F2Q70_00016050 [Brassica cretica]
MVRPVLPIGAGRGKIEPSNERISKRLCNVTIAPDEAGCLNVTLATSKDNLMAMFPVAGSLFEAYGQNYLKTDNMMAMFPVARQEEATMPAKQRTPKVSRNPDLIRGVGKYSRSQMYHKRGLWAIKAKNGGVFPRHDAKSKVVAVAEKPPKFYPAEDVKKPLANRRKANPTKLRLFG